jgi:SAM-dependent methyltransferase
MAETARRVAAHYGPAGLAGRVLAAIADAGIDLDAARPEDLAPIDQLHTRGLEATAAQARDLDPGPGMHLLDIGSGLGGPARWLAARFGCRVTGIDLTEAFCRIAWLLARGTRLAALTAFPCADACALPFRDETFDAALTQYTLMNVPDKARLFAEAYRVLKPGARLSVSCPVAGPGGGVRHYPVVWASDAAIDFTVPAAEVRAGLEGAGFRIAAWADETAETLDWRRRMAAQPRGARPALSPVALFGPGFRERVANIIRNLEEGRIAELRALAVRPA